MPPTIRITDLRGGIAGGHPAQIPENCAVAMVDVDFWGARCGSRRNGSTVLLQALANSTDWIGPDRPNPEAPEVNDDFWRMSNNTLRYWTRIAGVYTELTPTFTPADTFDTTDDVDVAVINPGDGAGINHIACKSTNGGSPVERLHIYLPSNVVRRSGLAQPAAPTVADTGAGTFAGARQYRQRYTTQVSGVTVRRSEASAATAFSPSGTGASARITKSADLGESETHWEVEELDPNGNWYRIATVVLATTTYDDSLALSGIASSANSVLSAEVGEYTVIPSARFVVVDDDRLVFAGDHVDSARDADVGWTPVLTDRSGVGNLERSHPDYRYSYRSGDDGGVTGLKAFESRVIVFKFTQIHQLTRTGRKSRAYLTDTITTQHGAVKYSVQETVDKKMRPCLVFLDREAGPMMLGADGIKFLLDQHLRKKWKDTFNASATVPCSSLPYPRKGQVWWHIATGASDEPDTRWVYHAEGEGITTHTLPNKARAACNTGGVPRFSQDTGAGTNTNRIVTGDVTGATDDYGTDYRAYIKTRAYQPAGKSPMERFNAAGAVVEADPLSGVSLSLTPIRDYGVETGTAHTALLTASGSEERVVVPVDDFKMNECSALQLEYGDPSARDIAPWYAHAITIGLDAGSSER